ncbi:MAG TPA: helix-turn-helix transcriptional regulator [Gemmatimonadales bacterium]|nr:helix-turn-helix transcriptional regulator [Gemmatimonadales bacterium]
MNTITLDWLHIVILLGAVQGLFLTGVLAARKRNRTANRILAVAMIAFTLYLLSSVYHAAHLEDMFPHFFGVAHPLPLAFGPLVYLYTVSVSDRSRRVTWRDALHFIPFVLAIVTALPIYLMSGPDKIAWYRNALRTGEVPLAMTVITQLKLLSGIIYTALTLLFLRRHRSRIRDNYSSLEHVDLRWLVRLAAASAVVWAIAIVINVTQMFEGPTSQRGEDILTLAIALLVYGIGYMALRQPEIFRFDTGEYRIAAAPPAAVASAAPAAPDESASRYERSGLSEHEAAALKRALLSAMDQKSPWRNSDLTLADLAQQLSTTPHKLSEVLNSQLEQSFYDFVNGYRVRYVQRRIEDEDARNLKILALALDAGFASKSTFNDVFKKHTGRTPSDYRRSIAV